MKILIAILVIALAVFLNSVELGTPLGPGFSFRPGAASRPVPVPSTRRQTGRGGRYGRQQSGRKPQTAAPETPTEESPSTARHVRLAPGIENKTPVGVYIEDPHRGFIKLDKVRHVVVLYALENVLIGRIEGEDILPIFNKRHDIIRIDYNKNGLRTPMDETEARRWGVFTKYSDLAREAPPAFL